ncbi:MAG: hypothetical protein LBL61_02170 [Elusimicrobiota bacterium]|jgi:hypothetical protein|nr:hypothetical protein [Elusimicrobiota bacterium]
MTTRINKIYSKSVAILLTAIMLVNISAPVFAQTTAPQLNISGLGANELRVEFARMANKFGYMISSSYNDNFAEIKQIADLIGDYSFEYHPTEQISRGGYYLSSGLHENFKMIIKEINGQGAKANSGNLIRLWNEQLNIKGVRMSLNDYFGQTFDTKYSQNNPPNFIVNSKKWTKLELAAREGLFAKKEAFNPYINLEMYNNLPLKSPESAAECR